MGIAVEDDLLAREVDETADLGRDRGAPVGNGDEERVSSAQPFSLPPGQIRELTLMLLLTVVVWGQPVQKCIGCGSPLEETPKKRYISGTCSSARLLVSCAWRASRTSCISGTAVAGYSPMNIMRPNSSMTMLARRE